MQTKACSKCKEERDISLFQLYKDKPNGQCRLCKTASEKIRRERIGIPVKKLSKHVYLQGNFTGWIQFRKLVEQGLL